MTGASLRLSGGPVCRGNEVRPWLRSRRSGSPALGLPLSSRPRTRDATLPSRAPSLARAEQTTMTPFATPAWPCPMRAACAVRRRAVRGLGAVREQVSPPLPATERERAGGERACSYLPCLRACACRSCRVPDRSKHVMLERLERESRVLRAPAWAPASSPTRSPGLKGTALRRPRSLGAACTPRRRTAAFSAPPSMTRCELWRKL